MEWQPIETAPRDGRRILVCRYNKSFQTNEYAVVWWYDNTFKVFPTRDMRLSFLGDYWMPLPSPPAIEINPQPTEE